MIHIYTGNGKGKTTSAFGLAMRADGQGFRVIIFQFLKPKSFLSGEENSLRKMKGIKLIKFNQTHPMFKSSGFSLSKFKNIVKKDFEKAEKIILSKKYNMVVLDEIINAIDQNFIDKDNFLKFLGRVPGNVELILTGRGDVSDIEKYADYVTIMIDKKHPFKKIRKVRKGIEY